MGQCQGTMSRRGPYDVDDQLREACLNCDRVEVIQELVRQGANVAKPDKDGWNALHNIGQIVGNDEASAEIAAILLDQPEVLVNSQNHFGNTTLHFACFNNNVHMARLLLNAGADTNIKDKGGWTPLHGACESGTMDLVRLLIRSGSSVYETDNYGRTPLDLCEAGKVRLRKAEVEAVHLEFEAVRMEHKTPIVFP